MEIALKLDTDSHNSFPDGELKIRRGSSRTDNLVLVLEDRQIEVNFDQIKKALEIL